MASLQLQTPATMENLPSDVLSNIFNRLFAKQLAQMRCVSKLWNALLSSSTFVKSHLHRSLHNNEKILLFFLMIDGNPIEPISAHSSRSPHLELTDFIKLPPNLPSIGAKVIGSIDGLICVYYKSDSLLHIWNPSISAVLTLPPYSIPPASYDHNKIRTVFRFGFDPKSDDYKVVKFTSLLRDPSLVRVFLTGLFGITLYDAEEWLQVEVYSMRKGSWNFVTQRFPSHITGLMREAEVRVDGHDGYLHWLCCTYNSEKLQTIVAFDLGVETFSEIHLPDSVLDSVTKTSYGLPSRINVLGVLGGKLCVMSCVSEGDCEVWVMDEYGVFESWAKHHVFSQFSGYIRPYGFTLHNEFLFKAGDRLALFDPIAEKVKIFKMKDRFGESKVVDSVVEYVDSLVWVAPSVGDISIPQL